ncbi:MAG: ABC transporter ATP-binding protein [Bacteroidia bacterium]|nr:ABC transporter ATP-binding protein [Bacteroidia bacterium]
MNKQAITEVIDVWKSFKTVQAVRGISMRIQPGEFLALLGPNGAGKTTLVEMIEGIQKPDKGEIYIEGKSWNGNEKELQNIIGISLQETHFIDKLTVAETLMLFASFFRLDRGRVNEIIEMTGLEEKRKSYVVNLSGGQRQRLALGIALLNKPKLLLLDEPTTGLDPNARREVWEILRKLKKDTGTSLILTTHYMEEAEQLCDYVMIIDHGQVLREGSLHQLLRDGNDDMMIEFTLNSPFPEGLDHSLDFNIQWDDNSRKAIAFVKNIETDLLRLLSFLREHDLQPGNLIWRKKTLDDLFTTLTGRHLND